MFIHFNHTFENNFQEVSHKFILLFDSTLIIHEVARTRPTANTVALMSGIGQQAKRLNQHMIRLLVQ